MRKEIVLGLMIFFNSLTFGFQKEVEVDMRKDKNILVITLSAEQRESTFKQYKVKSGDTLMKLSNDFEVKIKDIVEDNNIKDPNLIVVNQNLKIEDKESKKREMNRE